MNAVEIEEAVSTLAAAAFDAATFPYAFLEAFGNKETTLKRLKSGNSNQSDLPGGILQRSNIHIKVCPAGEVHATLTALRESPATVRHKAKFILATDGQEFQAESLADNEPPLVCTFTEFADHFGYFLPLAGITTVQQIRENAFDIKATGRLNRLYVELLRENPDWDTGARREDLNHFFARLIFCFFAEDTNIFLGTRLFTSTIEQMTARDASDTHLVLSELFRAMNTKIERRGLTPPLPGDNERRGLTPPLPNWAQQFPYVNGNLFAGNTDTPRFSKSARNYLLHVGNLDWTKINPDIFGSMIQAVADDEERGALGMHYTSVPNILKVLNPLFLDDLRTQLEQAGDNGRKLLNLRNRLARIRVFDPACGSGNFLVIAYKEMRAIEAEINRRRGGDVGGEPRASENPNDGGKPRRSETPSDGVYPRRPDIEGVYSHRSSQRSVIPLTNFRGIELRHFAAEIARLALIIAEYQCDVLYRGQKLALLEFLPLEAANWITCGNALRLDWLSVCPPTKTGVKLRANDLFSTPLDQAEMDFENEGGETYICGNPPYLGSRRQEKAHKSDIQQVAAPFEDKWRSLDYVSAWVFLARAYQRSQKCTFAFVTTSSLCEGLHISILWKHIISAECRIVFAHRSFKWRNLAQHNAGVSVVVVGVSNSLERRDVRIFDGDEQLSAKNINAYLVNAPDIFVSTRPTQVSSQQKMMTGAMPRDGGHLILTADEKRRLVTSEPDSSRFVRRYVGSEELINGKVRYCIWIPVGEEDVAKRIPEFAARFELVRGNRLESPLDSTIEYAQWPHRFVYVAGTSTTMTVAIGAVSSENRAYLPVDCIAPGVVCSNRVYAIYNGSPVEFALLSSAMHLAWAFAVCGRLEQRLSYSNTLGWNTFPVPTLTDQNKADLTRCAEDILLAREAHFPATIADLYDPDNMDTLYPDLRAVHERNDETLERIYIGRRFKNDTERLEKLFELYTQMTGASGFTPRRPPVYPRRA